MKKIALLLISIIVTGFNIAPTNNVDKTNEERPLEYLTKLAALDLQDINNSMQYKDYSIIEKDITLNGEFLNKLNLSFLKMATATTPYPVYTEDGPAPHSGIITVTFSIDDDIASGAELDWRKEGGTWNTIVFNDTGDNGFYEYSILVNLFRDANTTYYFRSREKYGEDCYGPYSNTGYITVPGP